MTTVCSVARPMGAAHAVELVCAVVGGVMHRREGNMCMPSWCGGTVEEPCRAARETDGQLHDDEMDAVEAQDEDDR